MPLYTTAPLFLAQPRSERVIGEFMAIGFADIRKVVEWQCNSTHMTGKGKNNQVRVVDSDKLPDEAATAISEISQSLAGVLKVKLHDKLPALVKLGEYLGIFDGRGDQNPDTHAPQSVDRPPRETYEEWIARRGRELKIDTKR